jgi:hypothetical protein
MIKLKTAVVQTRLDVPLDRYHQAMEYRARLARERGVRSVPLQEVLLAGLDLLLAREAARDAEHG